MTVQEAKKHLENMFPKNQDKRRFIEECIDIAIECMEEIEQYRALGTVEGFQKALDSSLEYYIQMKEYKAKLQEYEAIGTVEELKEAREKQVAKKVIVEDEGDSLLCPSCGLELMGSINDADHDPYYCFECGQKLDWEEGGTSD